MESEDGGMVDQVDQTTDQRWGRPTSPSLGSESPMQQSPDQSDYIADHQSPEMAEPVQSDDISTNCNQPSVDEPMDSEEAKQFEPASPVSGSEASSGNVAAEQSASESDSDIDSQVDGTSVGERKDQVDDQDEGRIVDQASPSENSETSQFSDNVSNGQEENEPSSVSKEYNVVNDDNIDDDDIEERSDIGRVQSEEDSRSQGSSQVELEGNLDSQDADGNSNNSNLEKPETRRDTDFENVLGVQSVTEFEKDYDGNSVSCPQSPPEVSSSSDLPKDSVLALEEMEGVRGYTDSNIDDNNGNSDIDSVDDNSRNSLDLINYDLEDEPVGKENNELSIGNDNRESSDKEDGNMQTDSSRKSPASEEADGNGRRKTDVSENVAGSVENKTCLEVSGEEAEEDESGDRKGKASAEEEVEEPVSSEDSEESESSGSEAEENSEEEDSEEESEEDEEEETEEESSGEEEEEEQTEEKEEDSRKRRDTKVEAQKEKRKLVQEFSKKEETTKKESEESLPKPSSDKIKTFVENRERERLERVRKRKERHEKQRLEELREKLETKSLRKSVSGDGDSVDKDKLKTQTSLSEDHVELDYDEDVEGHDDSKDKLDDSKEEEEGAYKGNSESDDGELEDDDDCEEGEIREPGTRKPFVKPICRFYLRGHCTWGDNCRFLHPGVNDKGNYQLIERPGFNNNRRGPGAFAPEEPFAEEPRSPSPEPPPPPAPPKEESAWERGLRYAKELMKKANERKECETNFEEKKMNLSIDENPEYNKENNLEKDRIAMKEQYYDKEVWSDDEYYDKTPMRQQQMKQHESPWQHGHYENFEVRWTREPDYPPAPAPHPATMRMRERYPPRQQQMPPPQRHYSPPNYERYERQKEERRMREKWRERPSNSPDTHPQSAPPTRAKVKADEWHDPWRRSKSPKQKRSRSRGRRRSRRSHSYSSSYSSSSYSSGSRSRSRSSSYSSYSSHSRSRSRSSSASSRSSKSPPAVISPAKRRRPPPPGHPIERRLLPNPPRFHEQPRSAVAYRGGRPMRSPDRRRPGPMPMHGRGGRRGGFYQGPPDMGRNMGRPPLDRQGGDMDRGRRMEKGPLPRKSPPVSKPKPIDRRVSTDQKKEAPEKPRRHSRSSSSRSRSRSRSSSSSSRASSGSSMSSRSSSSSSSGSADSEHLYRNIGGSPKGTPESRPTASRKTKAVLDKGKQKPPQPERTAPPGGMKPAPRAGNTRQDSRGEYGKAQSSAAVPKAKDPLKVTGQKSNIKLTLIKPSDKSSGQAPPVAAGTKKRPAESPSSGPVAKRVAVVPPATKTDKPVKKIDKPAQPVSPTKAAQRPAQPANKPMASAPAAVPVAAAKPKKSTVSRREELLKQLKAVEDAIARKRSKMS